MECYICLESTPADNLILTVDKSDLACDKCVSDIAQEMTVIRGEFKKV